MSKEKKPLISAQQVEPKKKIIHWKLFKEGEPRYLCVSAWGSNPDKMSKDWNKVTCKNCLKQKGDWI